MRITGDDGIDNGAELTGVRLPDGLVRITIDSPRISRDTDMASITLTPAQVRAATHDLDRLANEQAGG